MTQSKPRLGQALAQAGWGPLSRRLDALADPATAPDADLLELDVALACLADNNSRAAELVNLSFVAGMTIREAPAALGLPQRSGDREPTFQIAPETRSSV